MAIAPTPRRKPNRQITPAQTIPLPITKAEKLQGVTLPHVEFGERVVKPAIITATEDLQQLGGGLVKTQQRLALEREPHRDTIRAAQERLFQIEQNPEIFNRIAGLFDSDFNRDAQIRKMQQGKFELSQITNRMQEAEVMHAVETRNIKESLKGVTTFYSFTREGFLDTQNALLVGFQIRDNVRREQVQLVQDTTQADLLKWEQNPEKMPSALRGLERLVTAELFQRRVKESQLDALDISNTLAEQSFFAVQREAFFDQFDTLEQLEAAKVKHEANPADSPVFIKTDNFNKEMQNRQAISLELRSAQNSVLASDFELRDMHVLRAFAMTSETDLRTIMVNMGNEKSIELPGGVVVSKVELAAAVKIKADVKFKADMARAELMVVVTQLDSLRESAITRTITLGQADNPGGNPLDGLSSTRRAELTAAQNYDRLAQPFIQAGSTADVVRLSKTWAALNESLDKDIKERIDVAPKGSKAGLKSYYDNEGRMTVGAIDYSYDNAGIAAALDYDIVLQNGYRLYSEELGVLIGTKGSFELSGTTLNIPSNEKNKASTINQAVMDSGARTAVADSSFQILLQDTLQRLVTTGVGGPEEELQFDPNSVYASLISPQGTLASSMYEFTVGQEKVFMYSKFYQALAAAQLAGETSGVLKTGNELHVPLIDMMNQNATALNSRFRLSPDASAFGAVAFPNGIQTMIYERLSLLRAALPQIVANAKLQKDAMTDAIKQQIEDQTVSP